MNRLSLKNLDRICMLIILVVAGTFLGLMADANRKRQAEIQKSHRMVADRLKGLKTNEEKSRQIQAELADAREKLNTFNRMIPKTSEFGEFLDQIDSMMKKRELTLISIQPQAGVKEKTLTRIPVRMQFRGAFADIFDMVHSLETTGRIVVMDRIAIARSGKPPACEVELLANIFSR